MKGEKRVKVEGWDKLTHSRRACSSQTGAAISENCPNESAPGCAHNSSPRALAVKADTLLLHSCAGSLGRMD